MAFRGGARFLELWVKGEWPQATRGDLVWGVVSPSPQGVGSGEGAVPFLGLKIT